MKTQGSVFCGAVAAGLFLAGFGGSAAFGKDRVREEFHQTYTLAKNGRVQLDNVNGKVRITAWERGEIKVDAIKRGDSQADLDAVKIEVESKPDQIRISTKHPQSKWSWRKKGNSASVDNEIKVPAQARLQKVENVNGSLEIEGVGGEVEASTVNGKLLAKGLGADAKLSSVNGTVEAAFETLEGVKSVSVETVNGKVDLTLPANADAEVSASTVNGGIQGDGELKAKKNWPVGNNLRGTLGKGGTQVRAETVNGAIRIRQGAMAEEAKR
jgi:hypothetical protein